jgi:hypothetical protein
MTIQCNISNEIVQTSSDYKVSCSSYPFEFFISKDHLGCWLKKTLWIFLLQDDLRVIFFVLVRVLSSVDCKFNKKKKWILWAQPFFYLRFQMNDSFNDTRWYHRQIIDNYSTFFLFLMRLCRTLWAFILYFGHDR